MDEPNKLAEELRAAARHTAESAEVRWVPLACVVDRVVLALLLTALVLVGTGRPEPAGCREGTGGADRGRLA